VAELVQLGLASPPLRVTTVGLDPICGWECMNPGS
jgi:hypothetical protein